MTVQNVNKEFVYITDLTAPLKINQPKTCSKDRVFCETRGERPTEHFDIFLHEVL